MDLSQRDRISVWHPFTQHQHTSLPLTIKSGRGSYLFDEHGKAYLDLISSWWVNLHGHSHPKIAEAIYQQATTLEHVIFAGLTHEPAILLAEKILDQLPLGFSKVFYSDNGSTANEVALKMAYQYWLNQGEKDRKHFIAFQNGYHGDTFGSMAVSRKSGFFNLFEDLLFDVEFFEYPGTWQGDTEVKAKEEKILKELEQYLIEKGNQTAALLIEPLIQGAGGMQMCTTQFLRDLEKLIRSYNILIIYDEVMTGMGRTGSLFSCIKAETSPDIVCLAKGLAGGFLPLAITACQEKIYESFLGTQFTKALAHGHSFTANPLGCAAALASLDILMQPETQKQLQLIENIHQEYVTYFNEQDLFEKSRYCGTISAFNLKFDNDYGANQSIKLRNKFLELGLLIRPLGNVLYLLPPYCITEQELRHSYTIVEHEVKEVLYVGTE